MAISIGLKICNYSIKKYLLGRHSYFDLHDIYGGKRDIEKKIISVLSDTSFLDDPTRLFRSKKKLTHHFLFIVTFLGLRFCARYGFELENNTKKLYEKAVENKYVDFISSERIHHELRKIFEGRSFHNLT